MNFLTEVLQAKSTTKCYKVDRKNIHSTVLEVFQKDVNVEFPLRIAFEGEKGLGIGGVYRDMLSAFWADSYNFFFDGGNSLTPALHPQINFAVLPLLGKILSHGYLASGFLPLKITFPTLAALLIPNSEINDQILIDALLSNVSIVVAKILNKALKISAEFSDDQQIQLSSILYRFGSRQVPLRCNLQKQIVQAARHEFLTKPLAAIQAISSGIPKCHRTFWNAVSLSELIYSMFS